MIAGLVALWFFQGIRTSIAKKTYISVIFQEGEGGSGPPDTPSGSAHVFMLIW